MCLFSNTVGFFLALNIEYQSLYVNVTFGSVENGLKLKKVNVGYGLINRWYLGDFTKMEGTQMEMFNFLWLIWDHYLPLTPTRND